MKTSDIRDWANAEYGEHSHKAGQVIAALGPIEEGLNALARQGINYDLVPSEVWAKYNTRPALEEEAPEFEAPTSMNPPLTEDEARAELPPAEHFINPETDK